MKAEREGEGGIREVRLEGAGLVVVGGVLLAAICGAYYVGKWAERREHPLLPAVDGGQGPLSQVVRSEALDDAAQGESLFDELRGEQTAPEPGREARPEPARASQPPTSPDAAASERRGSPARDPGGDGDYWVQVFAGRDRSSAETLVGKLKHEGYVVKVFSEREGQGLLFKVRVGAYPSKERAQRTAALLTESGYSAWVPPLE